MTGNIFAEKCVFGLDIGTRSIVGTVGYKKRDHFVILAQKSIEHETRAMLDGQIHDISQVGETIRKVKELLEEELNLKLSDVCIAAAGRVLKTLNVHAEQEFDSEKNIAEEDIYALNSKAVEKAYEEFYVDSSVKNKFYCVGYSVVKYYLNDYGMNNLLDHKADKIAVDIIATFLPNEVVDGLNKAVEYAGLHVQNLTLEPIAAIMVAIPTQFRMLNIALVDVGAGTSDISITKDGSIVAYGMLPEAGDRLTEAIAKYCLVDFTTAEQIKRDYSNGEKIVYQDIMGLEQTMDSSELEKILAPEVDMMTKDVAAKMIELNGDKPVSAVFVVGGGGKIKGYTERLASHLNVVKERVALRGKEVMGNIDFQDTSIEKDSMLVTPIGICLCYYEQSNNFIFISFNKERVKLYDNGKLTVVDAAMNVDFDSECLFPRRGKELMFTINGKQRIIRGQLGEAAIITVNGQPADIHTLIRENDAIEVIVATEGEPASCEIRKLPEYTSKITIEVNGSNVVLPRFAYVNKALQTEFYEIQSGDDIEMANFYTVKQLIDCMDVQNDKNKYIYVNHQKADLDTKIYENFTVQFTMEEQSTQDYEEEAATDEQEEAENAVSRNINPVKDMNVIVNGKVIHMHGKPQYIFVDVFDYIDFDLSKPQGKGIVTLVNNQKVQYMDQIHEGDTIDIHWMND